MLTTVLGTIIFYHKNPSSLSEIFAHAKWVAKRKYKLGIVGNIIALMRASLPVSLVIGLYKGIKSGNLMFVVFKIVYDFGIFMGIFDFLITGKASK